MLNHPRCKKPEFSQKGLGLLEVLAAIALLALGVTSILGGFGSAVRWTREAYISTQAVSMAAGVIESYKARPDQIRKMPETEVKNLDIGIEPPPGVEATVAIEECDQALDLYQVVVRVKWVVKGVNRSEVLVCVWPGSRF